MDLEPFKQRIKEDPLIVILIFLIALSTGCLRLADALPSPYGLCAVIAMLLLVAKILFWPETSVPGLPSAAVVPQSQRYADAQEQSAAEQPESDSNQTLRAEINRYLLEEFDESPRYEYFYKRTYVEDQGDALYREVIESMKNDPSWADIALGVDEWVTIGFETLVKHSRGWKNGGTLNQLYIAAYRSLLRNELPISRGVKFARTVTSTVAASRRSGH